MTDTSSNNYKELAKPWFKEVFVQLDVACREYNIPAYLIGAQARNILLLEKGIKPGRGTMDIDFAVMMPDIELFDMLSGSLILKGFERTNVPYRFFYPKTDTVVDILPFGQVEEKGTTKFTDRKTEISMLGMQEVMMYAEEREIYGMSLKIAPLIGLVILKLISFAEKPEIRFKDLDDIHEILKNYFAINSERFYYDHLDTLDEIGDNFEIEAGVRLIGRDIYQIIKQNPVLLERIRLLLSKETFDEPGPISRYFLTKHYIDSNEESKKLFSLILKGLDE